MASDFWISLFTSMFYNTSQRKQKKDDKNCQHSTAQLSGKNKVVQILSSFSKSQVWTFVTSEDTQNMCDAVKQMWLANDLQEMCLFN